MSTNEYQPLVVALELLTGAGALVLPKKKTLEAAAFGKVWSGKKADGSLWTLTKNAPDDFVCTC